VTAPEDDKHVPVEVPITLSRRWRIWACPCCNAPQAIYEPDIVNAPVGPMQRHLIR